MVAKVFPRYSWASVKGVASKGSRLLRSFSPTNVSSATTSEKEMGKKPTTINRKGSSRSPMIGSP
jgi:hypothetical protein